MTYEPDQSPGLDEIETERLDRERFANLRRISDDPCHQATFDRLSAARLLRLTIYGLIEAGDWPRAARYTVALDRLERQDAHAAQPPAHTPLPASAAPSITARELYHQLKDARRAMQRARARPPASPAPSMQAAPKPSGPKPSGPKPSGPASPRSPSGRLPFT